MALNYTVPPRTVKLYIGQGRMTEVAVAIDSWEKLWHAVGYLSSWNTTYPTVEIYQDGMTDLVAVYFDAAGECRYVIGAVWHDDHYGFHS